MRIFVTGGTGFIGKFVIKKLNNGKNEILILSRNSNKSIKSENISFLKGNLADINQWGKSLLEFKPEACVHLAWEGIPDYKIDNSIKNLKYGLDLMQLLVESGCQKILATGSLWEYGSLKGRLSEDTPVNPFNAFTAAKNSLNWMGRELAKENNMVFLWTRLFYVYGPGQKSDSLIPYLTRCAKENIKPEIRNPDARNDFIYIEDVAEAIYQILIKCKKSDLFNIGSGKSIKIQYIIKKIFQTLGIKKGYDIGEKDQPDSFQSSYAGISKIRKKTGWVPKINIDEGIKRVLDFSLK